MAKLYESLGQNPPQKKESKENFLPDTKLQPSSRTVMKTLYNCFFFLKKKGLVWRTNKLSRDMQ